MTDYFVTYLSILFISQANWFSFKGWIFVNEINIFKCKEIKRYVRLIRRILKMKWEIVIALNTYFRLI